MLATALAGDVAHARAKAAAFVPAARQHSNVNWHAELALVAGVLAIREGDAADGIAVLETARHAPMSMPYYYGLARRFLHQARGSSRPRQPLAQRSSELTSSPWNRSSTNWPQAAPQAQLVNVALRIRR